MKTENFVPIVSEMERSHRMEAEETEQLVRVEMTLTEYEAYRNYVERERLAEVAQVLAMLEEDGRLEENGRRKENCSKEKKAIVRTSPRVSDLELRNLKEDAEELAEQRRFDALSLQEQVAEILKWLEEDKVT